MRTFDVVVIGAGPAGEVAAGRLGDAGLSVAIVEDRLVGGECSFWACMPSKALLRPYEALAEARRIPGAAEAATGTLDVQAVLDRRDEVIHDLDDSGQLPWLEDRGIALVRGVGALAGERHVVVGDEELEATRAVILSTGSLPSMPPIEGLDAIDDAWTNREATTAKAIPERLLIVGGGVVGVEMSQAFQTLGSQVTLIEGERRLLPREEEYACSQVTEALRGVRRRYPARPEGGARAERDGTVVVTTDEGGTAEGDTLLVALGRTPQTEGLGLETVGIATDRPVAVDALMRADGHTWLYAIGDVNGKALFTHMGKYQARIAADHILGQRDRDLPRRRRAFEPARDLHRAAGRGGRAHHRHGARRRASWSRRSRRPTSGNAGGSFYGRNAPGTARLLIDRERGLVVGATITGAEVADMLHAATIAIVGEIPLERLRHAVPCFPTRSEIWLSLLEQAGV